MITSLLHRFFAFIIICLLLPVNCLLAQNLVPNPGFETQTSCPAVSEITKAPPWNSPTLGTPDLYNSTCPMQNGSGRTGIGSSGIYCYSKFPNNREYIQARLTQPLVSGKQYCVSFYVKRIPYLYSVSTIGAYLSDDSVYMVQTSSLSYTPQVESPSGTQISSSASWTEISGNYTASGGERFIIIGNFRDDANSHHSVASSGSTDSVGYYQIDDVSVTLCSSAGIDEIGISGLTKIYPNPAMDAINIELENTEAIKNIVVYDMLSNRLNIQPVYESGDRKATLNTSQLPTGNYFTVITTESGQGVKRFAVVR